MSSFGRCRIDYQILPKLTLAFAVVAFLVVAMAASKSAAAGGINSGETWSGTIGPPAYMDTWTFSGTAGDRVIITAVTTSGTLDTRILLYPEVGPLEASPSCYPGYGFCGDQLDHQLLTTGLYTIVIQDYNVSHAGTYNISLLRMPGAVSSPGDPDGGAIASGQTRSGTINVASDMDAFQFYGQSGDRVLITAVTTSGDLDTRIILYPPGGGAAEASPSCYPGYGFCGDQLDHQLLTTGLYTIVIQDYNVSHAGTYNITLLRMPGAVSSPGDPDGGTIPPGQCLSGTINVASDMDAFQFYGQSGDRVLITAVTTSGDLDTRIILYPPGGGAAEASPSCYPGYGFCGDQLDHQLLTTGLYTIVIQDYNVSHTGTYNTCLTKIPPSGLRPGLYNPSPVSGATSHDPGQALSWDPVAGATGYDVYFGRDVTAPLAQIGDNLASPSIVVPPTPTAGVYYWQVITHTPTGDIQGPWWWFLVTPGDFNADGHPDLLWQHQTNGDVYLWYMNGKDQTGATYVARSMGLWKVVGTADLCGGDGKPDIAWQHDTTGDVYLWCMNGTTVTSGRYLAQGMGEWEVVGTADLNADGHPDLLWQHATSGDVYVWFMNGTDQIWGTYVAQGMGLWKVVATADLNADGHPDLLWQHATSGDVYLWYMNGRDPIAGISLAQGMGLWKVVAAVDLNADGHPDLVWQHATTGDVFLWYRNGEYLRGTSYIAQGMNPWKVVGPR